LLYLLEVSRSQSIRLSFAPLPPPAAEAQELESKHCLHVYLEFVMDVYFYRRLLDTGLVLGFELMKNNRTYWLHDPQKLLLLC